MINPSVMKDGLFILPVLAKKSIFLPAWGWGLDKNH
jgi:hypothetical protein